MEQVLPTDSFYKVTKMIKPSKMKVVQTEHKSFRFTVFKKVVL